MPETPTAETAASPQPSQSGAVTSITGALVITIAALHFGREIFIPLALSILLSFILAPPLLWLRRHGIPHIAAVVVVVLVAFSVIGGVVAAVGTQLVHLAENLPTYQRNIKEKIGTLRSNAPGGGLLERVTGTLQDIRRELAKPDPNAPPANTSSGLEARREPVPVVIEPGPVQPLEFIEKVLGPLLGPIATAGLVVLFLIFILIEREELRDRFIKLAGGSDLQRSTEAITEAARRVSRYLLMQLLINVTYAIPIGIGLYIIGVPNAMLWAVLAAVLRFIPYLGPIIGALFPLVITIGVDPDWSMFLWTIALFLSVELVCNNVLEPWLYGSSTGLSSFAIILGAIVWTLLWGPVGLFLSTPLTVCLVVIGRYVPSLEFLGVALGSDPVLTPAERFYQRLLARNVEEAVELAEDHVDETSSLEFYDNVALPALRLAQNDRQRSADVTFRRSVADVVSVVVREVGDHVEEGRPKDSAEKGKPTAWQPARSKVLCIGGRTELDHAAAEILSSRLTELGLTATVAAPIAVSRTAIDQLDLDDVGAICLCYLDPNPQVYARYVLRRLERRASIKTKLACCWNLSGGPERSEEIEKRIGVRATVVTTLAATEAKLTEVFAHARARSVDPTKPPPEALEHPDIVRLRALGLSSGKGDLFEWLAAKTGEIFATSIVLVTLADEACKSAGVGEEASKTPTKLDHTICREVVAANNIVAIENVADDKRFAVDAELLEKGIRFFAAAPLHARDGTVLGAVCILDSKSRKFEKGEHEALQAVADELMRRADDEADAKASRDDHAASVPKTELQAARSG